MTIQQKKKSENEINTTNKDLHIYPLYSRAKVKLYRVICQIKKHYYIAICLKAEAPQNATHLAPYNLTIISKGTAEPLPAAHAARGQVL